MIEQYAYNANGYQSMSSNVIDHYKGWLAEAIRQDQEEKRTPLVTITLSTKHSLNTSAIIRAANAFGVKETYIVGPRHYDKRAAVGSQHFSRVYHADDYWEVYDKLYREGYSFLAMENNVDYKTENINDVVFPIKTAFVFGKEDGGLPDEILQMSDKIVEIKQRGTTRSLNLSQAAAVAFAFYNSAYGY